MTLRSFSLRTLRSFLLTDHIELKFGQIIKPKNISPTYERLCYTSCGCIVIHRKRGRVLRVRRATESEE